MRLHVCDKCGSIVSERFPVHLCVYIGAKVKINGKWFIDNKDREGKVIWISKDKKRLMVKSDYRFSISTKNVEFL